MPALGGAGTVLKGDWGVCWGFFFFFFFLIRPSPPSLPAFPRRAYGRRDGEGRVGWWWGWGHNGTGSA